MRKRRFSAEQMVGVLCEADKNPAPRRPSGMAADDVKKLRQPEREKA